MKQATADACENCGATIGRLETPMVWRDRMVCGGCFTKLGPPPVPYAKPGPHPTAAPAAGRVQTVEQTGKRWKALSLVSVVVLLAGVACVTAGLSVAGSSGSGSVAGGVAFAVGALAVVVGFAGYAVARVCAWWFHG